MTRQLLILRRVAVVLGLLCGPSAINFLWSASQNQSTPFLQSYGDLLRHFVWGASKSYPLIAVWLVARDRLFSSFADCLRAFAYLIAATYGWVIGSAFQDWLHSDDLPMRIPGASLEHYGLTVLLLVQVAVFAWLFWPMGFVFRRLLADRELHDEDIPRLTIRFLLAWTAFAAALLTCVRLLAIYGKPLNIAIAYDSLLAAMKQFVLHMPIQIVQLIAIAIILIGFSGSRRHWLIGIVAATVFQFVGEQVVFWVTLLATDPQSIYGVMASPWNERVPFFAGTIVLSTIVFWFARVTGLVYTRARLAG